MSEINVEVSRVASEHTIDMARASLALDNDQQRVVDHREGPCLVLAAPGSGKTRVVTERYCALEAQRPGETLVLTYTVDAAAELRRRVPVGDAAERALLNFHSFARSLMRDHGERADYPSHFRTPDGGERRLRLADLLHGFPQGPWVTDDPDLLPSLLSLFDTAHQQLISGHAGPDAFHEWGQRRAEETVGLPRYLANHLATAELFTQATQRDRQEGCISYDELILAATRILETILNDDAAPIWNHLMVDEYQDTNLAQGRLVALVGHKAQSVMVVADDDQAIYGFRGAHTAQIASFTVDFPGHETIHLLRNYRSTREIVACTRDVMSHDGDPDAKEIIADEGRIGDPVEVWDVGDEETERGRIASRIAELISQGVHPSSIGWLMRRNVEVADAAALLHTKGVAVVRTGTRSLLGHHLGRDLMALLTAIHTNGNLVSLVRVVRMPRWGATHAQRSALIAHVRDGTPLEPGHPAVAARAALAELHDIAEKVDVRDLLETAVRISGCADGLSADSSAIVGEFTDIVERFREWSSDHRLSRTLDYLTHLWASGEAPTSLETDQDGVTVSTVHSAKGREWDYVFVSGATASIWRGLLWSRSFPPTEPTFGSHDVPQLAEERRLFYVALTRARRNLVVSFARSSSGSRSLSEPSPYVVELLARQSAIHRRIPSPPARAKSRRRAPRTDPPLSLRATDLELFRECPRQLGYVRTFTAPPSSPDSNSEPHGSTVITNSGSIVTPATAENLPDATLEVKVYAGYTIPPVVPPYEGVLALLAASRDANAVSLARITATSRHGVCEQWDMNDTDLDKAFGRVAHLTERMRDALATRDLPPRPSLRRCASCRWRVLCDEGRDDG